MKRIRFKFRHLLRVHPGFVGDFRPGDTLARLTKHARCQACQAVDVRPERRAIFSLDPDDTACFGNLTVSGFPRRIRVSALVMSLSLVFGCHTDRKAALAICLAI